jgi:hypothetical protein
MSMCLHSIWSCCGLGSHNYCVEVLV